MNDWTTNRFPHYYQQIVNHRAKKLAGEIDRAMMEVTGMTEAQLIEKAKTSKFVKMVYPDGGMEFQIDGRPIIAVSPDLKIQKFDLQWRLGNIRSIADKYLSKVDELEKQILFRIDQKFKKAQLKFNIKCRKQNL